ncbi:MAG TPA: zf-HC2 domain-containing protein, partial [Solirubrobacterales bacterium]|nr:zf-HC2 domain-containing protein [Solirubrobacterales bacterium]
MKIRNDCRDWRELLGVYALGQLEGDERVGLEAHLEGCAQCRAELAELEPVARMLPHADPERFESAPQPPPELGARIAATI